MDDSEILGLFLARSEKAIEALYGKYGRYCAGIAMSVLGNREDAEECVNDAYLRVWNSIPPNEPEPLRPYVGKIIRNCAIDMYERVHAKKRSAYMTVLFDELAEVIPDTMEDCSGIAEAIDTFLRTLDMDTRIIFIRRYWYADSIKALTASTGMSGSKITSLLFRTRNKLRIYLEKEGITI